MTIENHRRFVAIVSAGLPIPPDLQDWYIRAYERYLKTNEPLCTCLGISGAGVRRALIQRRDMFLKMAAKNCKRNRGESLWSMCKILSDQIKRYPRSKDENIWLIHLFELDCQLPQEPHSLFERIKPLVKNHYSASKNPSE
ncbi:MAG: hypothetical protein ABL903_20115 [Methylococcales bacterium]